MKTESKANLYTCISQNLHVYLGQLLKALLAYRHCLTKWSNCYENDNQRTNGPVNTHLISWSSKAQNIQNLENTW